MKILVLSDSHSGLSFMRRCIDKLQPQHVIHLGDHYDDATAMAEEHPHIRFHQVPGNCDRFRCIPWQPEVMSCSIAGVKVYMTHGHNQGVKSGTERLLAAARASGAQLVLYGHTHCPECRKDETGMWVLNPGTCGSSGGSVGLVTVCENEISSCRILRQEDLETFKPMQLRK